MSLTLLVNGESISVPQGTDLPGLLKSLGVAETKVALELNGELLPRGMWSDRELSVGDRLEVVTLVGGG